MYKLIMYMYLYLQYMYIYVPSQFQLVLLQFKPISPLYNISTSMFPVSHICIIFIRHTHLYMHYSVYTSKVILLQYNPFLLEIILYSSTCSSLISSQISTISWRKNILEKEDQEHKSLYPVNICVYC